jgi:glycosyltransferase involved in cell wall biosynthesis
VSFIGETMSRTTQASPLSAALTETRPVPARRRPLNVVLVDEELSYPPTSGKRIRTLNLTLRLARRHHLTYICHRNQDPLEAREAAAYFTRQGISTVVVDRAVPPRSGAGFYLRLAANLFSPLPYSVASHTSRALRRALREYAALHPVDLWHCEWTPYAQALDGLPGHRVIMAPNVESVIWRRYYETEENPLRRWYIGQQWRKFERFEQRALGAATRVVAVSDLDARRMERDFGVPRPDVVDNGVDTAYFRPQAVPRIPSRLLFLGSLDWRPNLDAVTLLLDRVFPAVRALEPSATLCLVGRNPPDSLRRRVAAEPGIELHGSVPDVRPFLAACGLLVVPLRIGGGSRLKILEALAARTPVVSTRIGAEGLCLDPDRHLTVVEEVDDLAGAIVSAIRAPAMAQAQAATGRERVLARYDWDILADRLEQVWLRCAAGERSGAGSELPREETSTCSSCI